jgi:hypothetical protein
MVQSKPAKPKRAFPKRPNKKEQNDPPKIPYDKPLTDEEWKTFTAAWRSALQQEQRDCRLAGDGDPAKYLPAIDGPDASKRFFSTARYWIANGRPKLGPLDIRQHTMRHLDWNRRARDLADWCKRMGLDHEPIVHSYVGQLCRHPLAIAQPGEAQDSTTAADPFPPKDVSLGSTGEHYAAAQRNGGRVIELIEQKVLPITRIHFQPREKLLVLAVEPFMELNPPGLNPPFQITYFFKEPELLNHPVMSKNLNARFEVIAPRELEQLRRQKARPSYLREVEQSYSETRAFFRRIILKIGREPLNVVPQIGRRSDNLIDADGASRVTRPLRVSRWPETQKEDAIQYFEENDARRVNQTFYNLWREQIPEKHRDPERGIAGYNTWRGWITHIDRDGSRKDRANAKSQKR